jgi:hypothetical protein
VIVLGQGLVVWQDERVSLQIQHNVFPQGHSFEC